MDSKPQQPSSTSPARPSASRISAVTAYRLAIIALALVIVGLLAFWQPWASDENRTVTVTGKATVSAVPDEFQFSPTYTFDATDRATGLDELTQRQAEIIAQLKELGVDENDIKASSHGYETPLSSPEIAPAPEASRYYLTLTITVSDRELAQKVQDYLVTTAPTGAVSPYAVFSDDKQSELETQAQTEATKDARKKAEQLAENLGFKLGKVKKVTPDQGYGIFPYSKGGIAEDSAVSQRQLSLNPGENEFIYSFEVEYYMR